MRINPLTVVAETSNLETSTSGMELNGGEHEAFSRRHAVSSCYK
jgi:hypothetical protein